jgi:hypothetical protein
VFYAVLNLSEHGRAGDYVRLDDFIEPIDVPTVWEADGSFSYLQFAVPYRQASVRGFTTDGSPVGNVRLNPAQQPSPVIWRHGQAAEILPHFGRGGIVRGGNNQYLFGGTGDPGITNLYYSRMTIWDADGTNPRLVTGIPSERATNCKSVNESGIYVGSATIFGLTIPTTPGAFVGRDGTAQMASYPGYEIYNLSDINNANQMVGTYSLDNGATLRGLIATAFTDEIRDLGGFERYARVTPLAINDAGVIVGDGAGATGLEPLIWPVGAVEPINLNTLVTIPGEPRLLEALDINNAGQILTRGFNGYYILTPIPEPAAMGLVCGLVLAMAGRRSARR